MGNIVITQTVLDDLWISYSTVFNGAFAGYTPRWSRIAMETTSMGGQTKYPWLQQMSGMREWIGDRQVNQLAVDGYSITNKDYENTARVKRNDIEDDQAGIYAPLFADFGQTAAELPDHLVFEKLKNGFTEKCSDGQFFFDTDHPSTDAEGQPVAKSNHGGGASTPWYLLCTKRQIKPIIKQNRRWPAQLTRMDSPTDPNVFHRAEYLYGVDGRLAAGYGFWQLGFGSKQTLNAANYAVARAAMMEMKGDNGRPLGIVPDLLVVPGSLESAARKIAFSENAAGGETNEWKGTVDVMVEPLLA